MSKKIVLVLASLAVLSGCASVAVTGDTLESRTSLALGLAPSDFTISNRTDSGIRTDYTVTTKAKQTFNCYVTGSVSIVGRVVSDAVCTQMSGSPASTPKAAGQCNALLKAAGKC